MALIDRLIPPDNSQIPKIPLDAFCASIQEYIRGELNSTHLATLTVLFGLTEAEKTELNGLIADLNAQTITIAAVRDVLMLAESRFYDATMAAARLGLSNTTTPDGRNGVGLPTGQEFTITLDEQGGPVIRIS